MAAPNVNDRLHLTGVLQKPPASLFLIPYYVYMAYHAGPACRDNTGGCVMTLILHLSKTIATTKNGEPKIKSRGTFF